MVEVDEKVLKELIEQTKALNSKVDKILEERAEKNQETYPLSIPMMLALPDNIRHTAAALSKIGEGTATQVALETKRTRAIESMYLNQLVVLGYARKKKTGHEVVFYMETPPAAASGDTSVSPSNP